MAGFVYVQQIIMALMKLGTRQLVWGPLLLVILQFLILQYGIVEGRYLTVHEGTLAAVDGELNTSGMEKACFLFVSIYASVTCFIAIRSSTNTIFLSMAIGGFFFSLLNAIVVIINIFGLKSLGLSV